MPVSKSMEVGPTMFDKIWITRFLANHFLVDSPIKLEREKFSRKRNSTDTTSNRTDRKMISKHTITAKSISFYKIFFLFIMSVNLCVYIRICIL